MLSRWNARIASLALLRNATATSTRRASSRRSCARPCPIGSHIAAMLSSTLQRHIDLDIDEHPPAGEYRQQARLAEQEGFGVAEQIVSDLRGRKQERDDED